MNRMTGKKVEEYENSHEVNCLLLPHNYFVLKKLCTSSYELLFVLSTFNSFFYSPPPILFVLAEH